MDRGQLLQQSPEDTRAPGAGLDPTLGWMLLELGANWTLDLQLRPPV